jgi:hypothetical protein
MISQERLFLYSCKKGKVYRLFISDARSFIQNSKNNGTRVKSCGTHVPGSVPFVPINPKITDKLMKY